MRNQQFDAVILDPIYKVITGDENNASDMGAFCNQFDKICSETGCSAIYCHHHSKGVQGAKRAMDRASGSGVFARDPDAQLDMIQLELTDYLKNHVRDGDATAWRLEGSLREFRNFEPVNFWFDYPIHYLDESGALKNVAAEGSALGNLAKSRTHTTKEERRTRLNEAYEECSQIQQSVTVNDLAEKMNVTRRTAREWVKEFKDEYENTNGCVFRRQKTGATEHGE